MTWNIQEDSVDDYFNVLLSALRLIPNKTFLNILLCFVQDHPLDQNLYLALVYIIRSEEDVSSTMSTLTNSCLHSGLKFFHPSIDKHFYWQVNFINLINLLHPSIRSKIDQNSKNYVKFGTIYSTTDLPLTLVNLLFDHHDHHANDNIINVFKNRFPIRNFYGCHRDLVNLSESQFNDLIEQTQKICDADFFEDINIFYPIDILRNLPHFVQHYLVRYHSLNILEIFDKQTIWQRHDIVDDPSYLIYPYNHTKTYFDRLKLKMNQRVFCTLERLNL